MKNTVIIINYGCSDLNNLNPNSASIIALSSLLSESYNIDIITDNVNHDDPIKCYDNGLFKIHSFPLIKKRGRSLIDINSNQSNKYINSVINVKNAKVCIAISYPFYPSVKIMNSFKRINPNLKTIIYEFDPLAYNSASKLNLINRITRIVIESLQFYRVDSIWLTRELFEFYNKNIFRIFTHKFKNIGIPLLDRDVIHTNSLKSTIRQGSKINIVYAGTFYDNIRSPKYLLELMKNIANNSGSDIILHIYGSILGDESIRIIREAENELKSNLVLHGIVNRKDISKIIMDADILVNVSNTVRNQLPSKVFEYIETCKPIISISSIKNDSSNFYLEKYPLSLLLTESSDNKTIKSEADRIVRFCQSNVSKVVDSAALIKLYSDFMTSNIAINATNILSEVTNENKR